MHNELHRKKMMRITGSGIKVLKAFMSNLPKTMHGYEIMQLAEISSGTLYPLLVRFEQEGLLNSHWEVPEPNSSGRPRRRIYQITGAGQRTAYEYLANCGEGAVI